MEAVQRRTIVGVSGLVLLWIAIYWAWEPRSDREPTLTFPTAAEIEPPVDEPSALVSEPETNLRPEAETSVEAEIDASAGGQDDPFGPPPFRWAAVREGDTLEKIAERELGSKRLWTAIARANPLKDPQRLRAGDRIKIPLDPANPQGRPETEVEVPEPPPVMEYTVRRGDTLSGIAKQFYGSVNYVDFLFDANRDRLRSADDLRLGQVLIIPPRPDGG